MQFLFSPTILRFAAGLAMLFAVVQAILALLAAVRRFRGEAARRMNAVPAATVIAGIALASSHAAGHARMARCQTASARAP